MKLGDGHCFTAGEILMDGSRWQYLNLPDVFSTSILFFHSFQKCEGTSAVKPVYLPLHLKLLVSILPHCFIFVYMYILFLLKHKRINYTYHKMPIRVFEILYMSVV